MFSRFIPSAEVGIYKSKRIKNLGNFKAIHCTCMHVTQRVLAIYVYGMYVEYQRWEKLSYITVQSMDITWTRNE